MKHYLTKDEDAELTNEFYADPSTEDMTFSEFMKWQGWKWDLNENNWYVERS